MTKSRSRGGQSGNQNARKHGLYSLHQPPTSPDPALDFNDQIARLRRFNETLITRLESAADPEQILIIQHAIDRCTMSIQRLLRIHLIGNPIDARQQRAIAIMTELMLQRGIEESRPAAGQAQES